MTTKVKKKGKSISGPSLPTVEEEEGKWIVVGPRRLKKIHYPRKPAEQKRLSSTFTLPITLQEETKSEATGPVTTSAATTTTTASVATPPVRFSRLGPVIVHDEKAQSSAYSPSSTLSPQPTSTDEKVTGWIWMAVEKDPHVDGGQLIIAMHTETGQIGRLRYPAPLPLV